MADERVEVHGHDQRIGQVVDLLEAVERRVARVRRGAVPDVPLVDRDGDGRSRTALERQRARQALDGGEPVLDQLGDRQVGAAGHPSGRRRTSGSRGSRCAPVPAPGAAGCARRRRRPSSDTADAMSLMLGSTQRMTLANSW